MWFQCPYEGGEGVWVQDNPGAPERNGCMVIRKVDFSLVMDSKSGHGFTQFWS